MGRPVMLGNSGLTVGLNEQGLVHDFYYPFVGLDNLTTARSAHHKLGVWVNGIFSWIDDGTWDISVDFETDALISNIRMHNASLGVELVLHDFVDSKYDAFCRHVELRNLSEEIREFRIFFHQVFQISRAGRADTALYEPEANYILDYKGHCSLLIFGQDQDGVGFDQYAVGNYGIEGKEGTFKDAEDGELSMSAVEHGGVDSVIRLRRKVLPHEKVTFNYWIIASDSQYNAERIHDVFIKDTLAVRLEKTRQHWHEWLATGKDRLATVDGKYKDHVKKSLLIIKAHSDKHGGIIASCDSSIYNYGRDYYSYVWPRDGAYAMWPLIRMGFSDEPKAFFKFCKSILTPDGYLMHKYQPDKAIGSTWHPLIHNNRRELAIQEDETAIIVYMLGEYYHYSKDIEFIKSMYDSFVRPASNFMCTFIDESTKLPHASYDLWEEKFLTSTYTVAVTYQALLTAASFADIFEQPHDATHWREVARMIQEASHVLYSTERNAYRKGLLVKEDNSISFDNTLDVSSMYGAMMYGLNDESPQPVHETAARISELLLNHAPSGGVPRYEHDNYFLTHPDLLGNSWIVTSLWLAQYYLRIDKRDDALALLDWSVNHAMPSGALPEQIDPITNSPVSVNPLVWSHAELINTVLDLNATEPDQHQD